MAKELSKDDTVKLMIKNVNSRFKGRNPLQLIDDVKPRTKLSTGVAELDAHLGGGYQKGNPSIVYGLAGSGKSTAMICAAIKVLADDGVVVYIDLEHKFDKSRAAALGLDITSQRFILIEDIEYAEEAMDIINAICQQKLVNLIIIDSIQGFSPKGEHETSKGKEKSIEDEEMALLARKMSKYFRMVANSLRKCDAAIVMVGQTRKGLGSFIVQDQLSGGNAVLFWPTAIVKMRRGAGAEAPTESIKELYVDEDGGDRYRTVKHPIGFCCVCKIEKQHTTGGSVEGTEFKVPFYFSSGFMLPSAVVEQVPTVEAVATEIAVKKGRKTKKSK